MPIDVEKLRQRVKDVTRGDHLEVYEIEEMIEEIEQLRAQIEVQRLELCRYDDAWCKTDEERKLRPR